MSSPGCSARRSAIKTDRSPSVVSMPRAGIRSVINTNAVITNNDCDSNTEWGIFTGFSENVHIIGNVASNSAQQHGIYVSNAADNPAILRNLVENTGANGIQINADLSTGGDGLISNWRWPTLGAIVAAREPRESFHAVARHVETGLVEISLVNDGDLDISSRLTVEARWPAARLIAGDGLHGFELAEQNGSAATFQNQSSNFRLPAGETLVVGWLRFDQNREVQLEVKKF